MARPTARASTRSPLPPPEATPPSSSAGPAPGGGSFDLFGTRPVLNDVGLAAFVAVVNRLPGHSRNDDAAGVFTVDAAGQLVAVLAPQPMSRANARRFLRGAVAINPAGA